MATYYVYILGSRSHRLYTGMTGNLARRLEEHRLKIRTGFTAKYEIARLLYFETTPNVRSAIAREKQIKGWSRRKKLALIDSINPRRMDLAGQVLRKIRGPSSPSLRSGSSG